MSNQSEGTLLENDIAAEELEWSEVSKLIQVGDLVLAIDNSAKVVSEKYFKKMPSGNYTIIVLAKEP